jgi:hypothetical protein
VPAVQTQSSWPQDFASRSLACAHVPVRSVAKPQSGRQTHHGSRITTARSWRHRAKTGLEHDPIALPAAPALCATAGKPQSGSIHYRCSRGHRVSTMRVIGVVRGWPELRGPFALENQARPPAASPTSPFAGRSESGPKPTTDGTGRLPGGSRAASAQDRVGTRPDRLASGTPALCCYRE